MLVKVRVSRDFYPPDKYVGETIFEYLFEIVKEFDCKVINLQ